MDQDTRSPHPWTSSPWCELGVVWLRGAGGLALFVHVRGLDAKEEIQEYSVTTGDVPKK